MTDLIANITCNREVPDYPNEHDLTAKLKEVKEAAVECRLSEQQAAYAEISVPPDSKPKLSDFDWLDERFQPFFERMPAAPLAMAAHLEAARTTLTRGHMSAFGDVASAVERWGGDTRDDFKKYFVNPFPQAVTNQQGVLEELRAGIFAYATMLAEARKNAIEIAEETIAALDGGGDGSVVLAVIAAAAGVAGAAVSGGSSLTITLAIIGGSTGVAGSIVGMESGEKDKEISGGTVSQVLESMQSALDELQDEMDKAEEAIAVAWEASSDEIEGYLNNTFSNLEKATLLPHEPTGDGVPNITNGGDNVSTDPDDGDFRPRT